MKMSQSEAGKLGAIASAATQARLKQERISKYLENPKLCRECSGVIPYQGNLDRKIFCGHSCSATYFNRKRIRERKLKYLPVTNNCIDCGASVTKVSKRCMSCQGLRRRATLETVKCPNGRRKLLISERGHKCESCKNETWLGKVIPLEVDHINGDHENHSRDNIRLLCPNCHALTPTYKNKNKGKGRANRKKYYLNSISPSSSSLARATVL